MHAPNGPGDGTTIVEFLADRAHRAVNLPATGGAYLRLRCLVPVSALKGFPGGRPFVLNVHPWGWTPITTLSGSSSNLDYYHNFRQTESGSGGSWTFAVTKLPRLPAVRDPLEPPLGVSLRRSVSPPPVSPAARRFN
jgi:hypothetical protein